MLYIWCLLSDPLSFLVFWKTPLACCSLVGESALTWGSFIQTIYKFGLFRGIMEFYRVW